MNKRILAIFLFGCSATELPASSQFAKTTPDPCLSDPRVTLGLISQAVCDGANLFFREPFGGNGRTCATCHPAAHNFTVDPAFIATLPASDPLFIAENGPPALAQLERPDLMHSDGLILENVDGADSPTTKFVMRSVPHVFALATSTTAPGLPTPDGTTIPPLQRVGLSGDGSPGQGTLRDFQTGAVFQHYTLSLARVAGVDFRLPTSDELDAIVAFLGTIGRTNEVDLTSVRISDPSAEVGRTTFIGARCNGCHHNAGANNAAGINRNFDTGIERARLNNVDAAGIPHDGGFGTQPHDVDGDGINDSFGNGTFNTPPLIEAADTGPFFHTNRFATIEDAITFYTTSTFANSPAGGGTPAALSTTDIANVGRFLRVLNAAMNIQLAQARTTAALTILANDQGNHSRDIEQTMASLAANEVQDAINDLTQVASLSVDAQSDLSSALASLHDAATRADPPHRTSACEAAATSLTSALARLGSGMTMTMGAGSLMF